MLEIDEGDLDKSLLWNENLNISGEMALIPTRPISWIFAGILQLPP